MLPTTTLQTCIVHPIRNSLDFVSWTVCKALAAPLNPIYRPASAEGSSFNATWMRVG